GAGIGWEQGGYRGFLVGLGLVYLLAIPTYLEVRRDLLMLALLAYSLVAVGSAGLGHWLADRVDYCTLLNLLGLVVLVGSALATLWRHHLYRESRQGAGSGSRGGGSTCISGGFSTRLRGSGWPDMTGCPGS